jgi:hypothetical protein
LSSPYIVIVAIGRAVVVSRSAVGKAVDIKLRLAVGVAAIVSYSSSTVLAMVIIVVKHRARLLVIL